jgi:hypothetical protein
VVGGQTQGNFEARRGAKPKVRSGSPDLTPGAWGLGPTSKAAPRSLFRLYQTFLRGGRAVQGTQSRGDQEGKPSKSEGPLGKV